jgi:peptidoglycan LD-endopeptidase LytH
MGMTLPNPDLPYDEPMTRSPRRLVAVASLLVVALLGGTFPALSITEEEVERARVERDRAAAARAAALTDLTQAVTRFEEITAELEQLTFRMGRLRSQLDAYEDRSRALRGVIRERAVEAYMTGGDERDPLARAFAPETVQANLIAREVLAITTEADTASLDSLVAVTAEMDRLKEDLAVDTERVAELRADSEAVVIRMNELFDAASAEASGASAAYTQAAAALEERRRREEAERRRRDEVRAALGAPAEGVPMWVTPGLICPIGGRTWFIDSWHAPRSGGRLHKGTDMFSPRGTPLVAVGDGRIRSGYDTLGGNTLWLFADHGVNYFYAHLDSFPIGLTDGQRVGRGQVVGYVGDTGNPAPGAYHLHFGIYPGGVMAVNPYPTVNSVCS